MKLKTLMNKKVIIGSAVVIAMGQLALQNLDTVKGLNNIAPAAQQTVTYTNDTFRAREASKLVLNAQTPSF